jgi:itaconate CoA-transferase
VSDALTGVRVVAVEQAVAAPLCSRHLADLGASVVKVEHPDRGDFARHYDGAVNGFSSHFVWLNRGKQSVALDLKDPAGCVALDQLLASADVLVSNLAPGAMERIVPDELLAQRNPRLIRCYISGYGARGPYATRKAYDLLVQSEAGVVAATGTPGHPAKPGVSLADVGGGAYAFASIAAALYERERTGRGRRIDIALFDVLLEWMSPLLLPTLAGAEPPPAAGLHHASIAPYGPFRTADEHLVVIAVQNDGQWQRLCAHVLDAPELAHDPRFWSNPARVAHRAETDARVGQALAGLTVDQAERRLRAADIPFGAINDVASVTRHPQAAATHRWSVATLPDGCTARVVTPPWQPTIEAPPRHVPALGEHTNAVLGGLHLTSPASATGPDERN